MDPIIHKYLSVYGAKEHLLASDLNETYGHVLVIPAYGEGDDFLRRLKDLPAGILGRVLVIVVINEPADGPSEKLQQNRALEEKIANSFRKRTLGFFAADHHDILVLNARFFRKEGVGGARKIGCDMALALIHAKKVHSSIIHTTDADADLPKNYFQAPLKYQGQRLASLIYPFVHERPADEANAWAIFLYEERLKAYVSGLKYACSPYAFFTIGSTLAIDAKSYAAVRGFPKKTAGEDFYILNKLKKIAPIISLEDEPIKLSARPSDRVPFGTGPAVRAILAQEDPKNAALFYDPHIFRYVKGLLDAVPILLEQPSQFSIGTLMEASDSDLDLSLLKCVLMDSDFFPSGSKALQGRKTLLERVKAFHDWFDAFRTLKFIHHLRDRALPMCNYADFLRKTAEFPMEHSP